MTETANTNGSDTRFQPGQSGNPGGRPKGSRTKALVALDALAEGEAEGIVRAMIKKAQDGDVSAATAILTRAWPPRKGSRISFNLPAIDKAEDLPRAIASITRQVADGEISPDEGVLVVGLLEAQRKAIETNDLAARIAALEERTARK